MSRSIVSTTVQRIKRQLGSSFRYEINVLQTALSTTDTVVTFTYDLPPSVVSGAILNIANEEMRVMSIDKIAKQATVLRGYSDSEANSYAIGSEISINPRFSGLDVFQAIEDEITGWGPDLYRIVARQDSISEGAQSIAFPMSWKNIYGLVDIRKNFQTAFTTSWSRMPGQLQRGVAGTWPDGPASGIQFRFYPPVQVGSVYFVAAAPFYTDALSWSSDLVDDVGLSPSMIDIVDLGVKWRLLGDAEAGRSSRSAQDTPRRAEEVPPKAAADEASRIYQIYIRRKAEEIERLRWSHPVRIT